MEVHIISREVIKPSSPEIQHKKPYKLSLFDQLTPQTYVSLILFYPMNKNNSSCSTLTLVDNLKKSLSETLNIYYPFSGRTHDNLHIENFNEGVPFLEAKVNCLMSKFLKHYEIESLNHLLPNQPFTKEVEISIPLVGTQVNKFICGGIAIGTCLSHKLTDGQTAKGFMQTWASLCCRNNLINVIYPNLEQPSLFFPPKTDSFPQTYLSLMENLWFTEANYVTRRFVFNSKAIESIRANAKGKIEVKPSRVETLTCFIWKYCMKASNAVSRGSPKPSILVEAVNLRNRTSPPMSNASIGNLFWWATAVSNPSDTTNTELHELMKHLREAIGVYKSDYIQTLQGNDGFETMFEYFDQLEALFSMEKPDIFAFTSWCYLGFTKLNFGWGEPFWDGIFGKVGPAFRNLTVFIETAGGKGIEAWITLDKERMSLLENDPEFLAFASPNPKISSL